MSALRDSGNHFHWKNVAPWRKQGMSTPNISSQKTTSFNKMPRLSIGWKGPQYKGTSLHKAGWDRFTSTANLLRLIGKKRKRGID